MVIVSQQMRSLITSYRFIADKPGMRALIADKEESVKSKMKVFFLRICNMLVLQEEFADVRSLLSMIDEDVTGIDNDTLHDKVAELLRYAIFEQQRDEEAHKKSESGDKPSPDNIRSYYDSVYYDLCQNEHRYASNKCCCICQYR